MQTSDGTGGSICRRTPRLDQGMKFSLLVGALLTISHASMADTLVMNEVMAANDMTIADEDGDYSDWIEFYNAGSVNVDFEGYGISDDVADPFKWVFPYVPLAPGSIFLVFASGKDRTAWPGELHTNFAINASGEEVILTSPEGLMVDSIGPVAMGPDVSYGRVPDGANEWYFIYEPTPWGLNGDEPPLQRAPAPMFSLPSGFYQSGTYLSIMPPDSSVAIRYTLDGGSPSDFSALYTGPIGLDSLMVIRASGFITGMLPSLPVSGSYIVGYQSSLPIVSIVTDPVNLWSDSCGIYVEGPNADPEYPHDGANYYQDWEIPIHVDYLEPSGLLGFSMEAGAKICGVSSRAFPQKSLRIIAREGYGVDRIHYQIFPDLSVHTFKSMILRNSGNDWYRTMIRDALMTGLMDSTGIAHQAYRPAVVLLNGAYWGIHNVRERLDDHFVESHYGVHRDSVDIVRNYIYADAGDVLSYRLLDQFVAEHDMSDPVAYDSVQTMMNVEDFIRYEASEIYYANLDWPWNNIKCWRPRRADGRFQWMLYDTDLGFGFGVGYDHNTLEHATDPDSDFPSNPPHSTLLLRCLLNNDAFQNRFVAVFCELMNRFLSEERVLARIETLAGAIAEEMPSHDARWYPEHDWEDQLEILREFAGLRKAFVVEHLRSKFGLDELVGLTVHRQPEAGGRIRVNGFLQESFPWEGDYFRELPIELIAEPNTGYRFVDWQGDVTGSQDSIIFSLSGDISITARFMQTSGSEAAVVITEINYTGPDEVDPGDWIELYALSGNHHLSGWAIRDEQDDQCYVFPAPTVLSRGEYLILVSDRQAFFEVFPEVTGVLGDLGFGLSGDGDEVRLYDSFGRLVDMVAYDDEMPWPAEADGEGPTLQLADPTYPNQHAYNWRASLAPYGDPGQGYDARGGVESPNGSQTVIPTEFRLVSIRPNPSSAFSWVTVDLAERAELSVTVYDICGRLITALPQSSYIPGRHVVQVDGTSLPSGFYLLRLAVPDRLDHRCPLVILR